MRLLELSGNINEPLNMHGSAKRVLDWFVTNSERLANSLPDDPSTTKEQRREAATAILSAAVRLDEIEADREIIRCGLSEEKISEFKSDAYAATFAENSVERLFEHAGAFLYLASDADVGTQERVVAVRERKGFLADLPMDARTHWARLGDNQCGAGAFQPM